ncbi:MAG TPA: helicase-exonuclease AddAB subunit AddB [Bacillota bacterium]|nr:helicase-exonuclease AddAB subunit AddB [Bacillota bacterium]
MGLRFLFGRAGTKKDTFILEEIKRQLIEQPIGPPIFYMVPEQMTFQQEYNLFKDPAVQGSIRAQVMSFSRLGWRVLQETGGGTRRFISSVGIQTMLRKIIDERTGNWQIFQSALEKQGFLAQLERLITEFKRYNITPEMINMYLIQMEQKEKPSVHERALQHKLADLSYIYGKLTQMLQHTYIDAEDQLQMLTEKIPETTLFNDAIIYLEGFHRLTPKELQVIEALMKRAQQMTVSLTGDHFSKTEISNLDLFYQTNETYRQFVNIAENNSISLEEPVILQPMEQTFQDRPYFAHLEKYFNVQAAPPYEGDVPITLAEAVHPRAEVEGVAQEIIRLVREENYRYRDMAIFIRETDTYHHLLETLFTDYNIPIFIDEKKTMLNHPLIECIRSLIEMVVGDWKYDAIFRVLKTGLIPSLDDEFPLTDDAVDELENYVLEYGIRSRNRWLADEKWVFQRFRGFDEAAQTDVEKDIETKINRYRQQVVQIIQPFDEKLRSAKTIKQFCETIYLFLESINVPDTLEKWRTTYDSAGNIEKGREQDQVWDAVIQLLDEMVEIAGDDEISLDVFRTSLEAGFESLQFTHVPPTIDHVIVGTIDHSRITGVKCAFLLGVNDGVWPMKPPVDGVINENERAVLEKYGIQLADSSERQLLDDWFYMYLAFTAPSNYLWVSYPLSDTEGEAKIPSQLVKHLQDIFPTLEKPVLLQDPDDLEKAARFITTPLKTRAALTTQLARKLRGYHVEPIWLHVLNWYIAEEEKYETTYKILQSLFYENVPTHLQQETVEQLYPKQLKTSVSRLEMYHRCSFQHFAQYSLQLSERRTYKLDAPDIGQLFHEALKQITKWVNEEGRALSDLTKAEAALYAKRAIQQLAPVLQHQILHSSNRYKYIQRKLQEIISRATYVMSEQARVSEFTPVGIELGFGLGDHLPPLRVPLPNGYELLLRGRIDRVDKAKINDQLYLRIIDYKSSAQRLNLLDVYYGLALQMLTYLDVILTQSEQWLGLQASPAGILYFHVHHAMISENEKISDEQLEKALFKQYQMQGMVISDEQVARSMDTSLEAGNSDIIPVGLKKSGGFYSRSKIANEQTFSLLQAHIRQLMINAGLEMVSGKVTLNPFEFKQQNACRFCPFDAVCQFDPILEHNNYNKLKPLKDDDVLQLIEKEVDN